MNAWCFRVCGIMLSMVCIHPSDICGQSGSGKTQLCQWLAAVHAGTNMFHVHYIDTHASFSAHRIVAMLYSVVKKCKDPSDSCFDPLSTPRPLVFIPFHCFLLDRVGNSLEENSPANLLYISHHHYLPSKMRAIRSETFLNGLLGSLAL